MCKVTLETTAKPIKTDTRVSISMAFMCQQGLEVQGKVRPAHRHSVRAFIGGGWPS